MVVVPSNYDDDVADYDGVWLKMISTTLNTPLLLKLSRNRVMPKSIYFITAVKLDRIGIRT